MKKIFNNQLGTKVAFVLFLLVLLQVESYALVMGTLLCFAILSFTIVMTHNIDWYARNKKAEESAEANHEYF